MANFGSSFGLFAVCGPEFGECSSAPLKHVSIVLVRTIAYTALMRNITLSATDQLIDQARDKARAQGVTLNDEFRKWLASYVQAADGQSAVNRFRSVMQALPQADAGRSFTREEMNER